MAKVGIFNLSDKKVSSAILYDNNLNSIDNTALIVNRGNVGISNEFAVDHSLGVSGDKNMLNWAAHLGQDYKHTKINFLHLGDSYPSEEIDQQAKTLFRNVNTEYIGVDGDWVYKGIFGSFIGNNQNATPANKLGLLKSHSDANFNINNLKFMDDGSIKEENYNLLRKIYFSTNGERQFNVIGKGK